MLGDIQVFLVFMIMITMNDNDSIIIIIIIAINIIVIITIIITIAHQGKQPGEKEEGKRAVAALYLDAGEGVCEVRYAQWDEHQMSGSRMAESRAQSQGSRGP